MSNSQITSRSGLAASAGLLLLAANGANAFGPFGYGGGYNGGNGNGNGNGNGFGTGSNGFPANGGFANGAGFDVQSAIHYRTIHGILAAVAFVGFFPIGSIFMRLIPGRFALWAHAITQLLGYIFMIVAAALGFYLVAMVRIPFQNGNLLQNNTTKTHPILGIVVLATLLVQPILGWIHHAKFKRIQRRQIWSYLHIWNGRFGITVGIINGAFGLYLAGASQTAKLAYIVVAAIMWFLWMVSAVIGELRRRRAARQTSRQRQAKLSPVRTPRGSASTGRSSRV